MKEYDTIAAISTGVQNNGIAIIRVSGKDSISIVEKIFMSKNNLKLNDMKAYTMKHGFIIDSETKEIVDEVIVSIMRSPKSYTTEDVVEINCHGGIVPTHKVLEEVIKNGARLAERGEFTKRAFLNGRIDLSQAEAVMDIINSKTETAMKSAVIQSQGKLSDEIEKIRKNILEVLAKIEASIDFPEDEVEEVSPHVLKDEIYYIISDIDKLIKSAGEGKILREGLNTVLIGKPNVGKSSLMNELINENRSIVTDIPGTTRDIIQEYINIEGIPVKIVDTAGIRETQNKIEVLGVKKSIKEINSADLQIAIFDISRNFDEEDKKIIDLLDKDRCIVVFNKIDLKQKFDVHEVKKFNFKYFINLSAKNGSGIDELKKTIKNMFFSGDVIQNDDLIISNERHKEALVKAKQSLFSSIKTLDDKFPIDIVSTDIKDAWMKLGEITGDTLNEKLIDMIFSKFCIGK